jgi:hypothetical protein
LDLIFDSVDVLTCRDRTPRRPYDADVTTPRMPDDADADDAPRTSTGCDDAPRTDTGRDDASPDGVGESLASRVPGDWTNTDILQAVVALAVVGLLVGAASAHVLHGLPAGPSDPAPGAATTTEPAGADSSGAGAGTADNEAGGDTPDATTPEPRPEFVYWTADISPCGALCRNVEVAIRNAGTAPARSVHVDVELTTRGTFGRTTLWTGETTIDRLPVNETHRETRTIEVARSKVLSLKANGCTTTAHVTIDSATHTQSFEETKQLDCSL